MQFELSSIIPKAIADRPSVMQSDIWGLKINFSKGKNIKITAPSGTGKTTLVNILYGLNKNYTGQLLYNQKDLATITPAELSNLRQIHWSIVFQDLKLFPAITARENIELKRTMQKPVVASSEMEQMAKMLGIDSILNQPAGICSYGEQQRIAIVRALMQPFDFLILDEPFSHLDINNKKKAAQLIQRECEKRGAGIIITDLDKDEYFDYQENLKL
ncbi:ATP-binding cassette domain-containing protein [Sediminibacterium salmoneum]|uniref:ATP-binding cassette domain-containing protein n=1 Tax=Sediminibacterium salmoneum TaxID=426421 RepID=UPI00047B2057|nr:ATP-binding cassette domain-containing protein [Sediminibacterium salmoneum]